MNIKQVIWKFPVDINKADSNGILTVEMPKDAIVIALHLQKSMPTLWAWVRPDNPITKRQFVFYGTGTHMLDGMIHKYVGTVLLYDDSFVLHVFELLDSNVPHSFEPPQHDVSWKFGY